MWILNQVCMAPKPSLFQQYILQLHETISQLRLSPSCPLSEQGLFLQFTLSPSTLGSWMNTQDLNTYLSTLSSSSSFPTSSILTSIKDPQTKRRGSSWEPRVPSPNGSFTSAWFCVSPGIPSQPAISAFSCFPAGQVPEPFWPLLHLWLLGKALSPMPWILHPPGWVLGEC